MDSSASYYELLGIPATATEDEIRRAYRAYAKRLHPDVSVADDATRQFVAIQNAYEVLSDQRRRALYDAELERLRDAVRGPLRLSVALSHPRLQVSGDPQMLYALVRIGIAPGSAPARPPLNLCVVLDNSLSMDGARLRQARSAAQSLLDRLHSGDRLSVVAFSDRARVVVEGPLDETRLSARERIGAIEPDGGTELLRGLSAGLEQVRKWRDAGTLDRLLLLTDGQTYGDEAECVRAANAAGADGIALILLGLGGDWNEKLLDEMAARSGGRSAFVDSPERLEDIFQSEFSELSAVVASDVLLACRCSPNVQVRDVYRVATDIARLYNNQEFYRLGALSAQHELKVLLELVVASASQPGTRLIAHLSARASPLGVNGARYGAEETVEAPFSTEVSPSAPVTEEIAAILARIAAFKVQERAMAEMERGQLGPASERLKALATHLLSLGDPGLAHVALQEVALLAQTGQISPEGRKRIHYGTRDLARPEPK